MLLNHKNNESLPFTKLQMNLEEIILSKISQMQKYKCFLSQFACEKFKI